MDFEKSSLRDFSISYTSRSEHFNLDRKFQNFKPQLSDLRFHIIHMKGFRPKIRSFIFRTPRSGLLNKCGQILGFLNFGFDKFGVSFRFKSKTNFQVCFNNRPGFLNWF